jgi:general secretion pathway protein F
MVFTGEASGSLDVVLKNLADFGERQQALRSRFKAALAYPIFMSLIGTGVLFFLIAFIIPNITSIFIEMEHTLPLPTVVLIEISHLLKSYWWLLALALAGIVAIVRHAKKRPRFLEMWDRMKLGVPLLGPILQKIYLARFGGTLGSLLQSGVTLVSALQIVGKIIDNSQIARVIEDAIDDINAGRGLSSTLSQSRWFPPMVIQMISVGEQSGELESMLNKIAESHEREVESNIIALTSILEPVMILVMGLIVGFVVVSILLPIFEMNQMIL